ncbi:MAG: hypothetical protein ABGX16_05580 [Pirellulales bacterium]
MRSVPSTGPTTKLAEYQIGYSEYRANLPGVMHPYQTSRRACIANADGSGRRRIADELLAKPHYWTQFVGWSPNGQIAIINRG